MVSREHTADVFQIASVLVFMRTCQLKDPDALSKEYENDESFRSHVAFLKMLLPPEEAATVAIANGWTVVGQRDDGVTILQRFATSEEAMKSNLRDVTRQLTMRIKTNLLAKGAERELLDVSFDDTDGFRFVLTDKAMRLNPEGSGSHHDKKHNRELTLKSVERFGLE